MAFVEVEWLLLPRRVRVDVIAADQLVCHLVSDVKNHNVCACVRVWVSLSLTL